MNRHYAVAATYGMWLFLAACAADVPSVPIASGMHIARMSFDTEWSEPVHLDAPVNSTARELGAQLSPDGLSIYLGSDRDGSMNGTIDIWAVRRACLDCPWTTAVNLGPNVNSTQADGGPTVSADGHLLFFSSNRAPGTLGGDDLWVSYRTDVHDDLAWEPAVNLGSAVNTSSQEAGPAYVSALGAEGYNLYFSRAGDIYAARVNRRGEVEGEAVAVAELNSLANDMEPSIRGDGRELVFWSPRGGNVDLWFARRDNPHEPWSTPFNAGPVINTAAGDLTPNLSFDGRTLLWSAAFAARGGLGFQDVWMSTRKPGGPQ